MSGNVIRLIPEGSYKLIPAPHIIRNLRSLLDDHSIFYDIHVFDSVQFIDQGGNFEYVACLFVLEYWMLHGGKMKCPGASHIILKT